MRLSFLHLPVAALMVAVAPQFCGASAPAGPDWFAPLQFAAETNLKIQSEDGDLIGQGQSLAYGAANSTFDFAADGKRGIRAVFTSLETPDTWYITLAAPPGERLTTGTYEDACRAYAGQSRGQGGLYVARNHAGCIGVVGRFVIHELTFTDQDEIASLRATFEQHCDSQGPALRGEIRINAQLIVPANLPPAANCPLVVAATCPNVDGTPMTLRASVSDADGDSVTVTWETNGIAAAVEELPARSGGSFPAAFTGAFPLGLTAVRLVLVDASGNTNFCHTTVSVPQTTPPTLTCATNMVFAHASRSKCSAKITVESPFINAPCGNPRLTWERDDGLALTDPFPLGPTYLEWKVTDDLGGSATAAQIVIVLDRQPPVVRMRPIPLPPLGNAPRGTYVLGARENCDLPTSIYVSDLDSGLLAGPFSRGDRVRLIRARNAPVGVRLDARHQVYEVRVQGRPFVFGVDSSGNVSRPMRRRPIILRPHEQ